MQIFGIPMVGADICGFNGNTTEELCSRWMQLGSFYPFSRNHNSISSIPQEPWAFDSEQHIEICRTSLNIRYTLLPYFYNLFYFAHTSGTPVWNALMFLYTNDPNTLSIDQQFMVGDAILVSPVLMEGATSVNAYFPADVWYDFYTGERMNVTSQGKWIDLPAPITTIPVHLRGGTIIPAQLPALTTAISRNNPFFLIVSLNDSASATGNLYLDDGENLSTFTEGLYSFIEFSVSNGRLTSTVTKSGYEAFNHLIVGEVKIYGQTSDVSTVTVNGVQTMYNYLYNSEYQTLIISGLILKLSEAFTVTWN
jgi:alpha-glucosidase (family GH31 glycosyl hydrolase)